MGGGRFSARRRPHGPETWLDVLGVRVVVAAGQEPEDAAVELVKELRLLASRFPGKWYRTRGGRPWREGPSDRRDARGTDGAEPCGVLPYGARGVAPMPTNPARRSGGGEPPEAGSNGCARWFPRGQSRPPRKSGSRRSRSRRARQPPRANGRRRPSTGRSPPVASSAAEVLDMDAAHPWSEHAQPLLPVAERHPRRSRRRPGGGRPGRSVRASPWD